MTVKVFLELVEIKTKLASLFPFLIGVLYSLFYFDQVKWGYTVIFFIGMLVFDMATTAINNFMDYRKAKNDTYKYEVNIVGQAGLSEKKTTALILGMIGIAALVGIYLSIQTGLLLLIMGGICCFIGVFYTFGPVPLSRMPLGEVFSGVTMGFGIFMMTIYINTFDLGYLQLGLVDWSFALTGNLKILLSLFWVSLPMVFTIANIMLANNLCDLEEDQTNHRYTLPFYIGKKHGIQLFNILMYASYCTVLIGIFLGLYHWSMVVILVTLPLVRKNLAAFNHEQIKRKTFVVSIKNLILFNSSQIVGLLLGLLLTFKR